jgi:hypothetical protein
MTLGVGPLPTKRSTPWGFMLGCLLGGMFVVLLVNTIPHQRIFCAGLNTVDSYRTGNPFREPDGRLRDTLTAEETTARDTLRRAFCGMK